MKKHLSTIILILIFLIGLCVLLYPSISSYINQKGAAEAVENYDRIVSEMDEETATEILKGAEEYNETLFKNPLEFSDGQVKDTKYKELLDITGTGMMGYISISKLGINLPIYHGTDDDVLNKAVGHLQGSSLPVGGINTHSILTAHRGLPTAKLFTNLDKLAKGDTFEITVVNKVLTYQVDDIKTVLPDELQNLEIIEGKDYITLVTCTPYAVNTHRLLIRGKRIAESDMKIVTADAIQIDSIIIAPLIATPMFMILFIFLFVSSRKKKQNIKWSDFVNEVKK